METLTALAPGHVGINVTDLDRSIEFYRLVLNLDVAARADVPGRHAFLAGDGKVVLTLWEQAARAFDAQAAGLHHLSFEVDTLGDVHDCEARVQAAAGRFVHDGAVAHAEGAPSGGIFFLDPDGTRLEVFSSGGAAELRAPGGAAPTCGFF